jgi:[ribosomal protein S18]-alanine N-acetyltransferase
MTGVRVTPMADGDIDAVGVLEHTLSRRTPEATLEDVTERLRADMQGPLMCGWVARDDEVVGYFLALHAADEMHVLNVATLPSHRRQGIGRLLVDAALAYARASGVRLLVLEVRASNGDAIRLYRRVGFAAMGYRRRYYPDDEDALEMHLELDLATGAVVAREDEVTLP